MSVKEPPSMDPDRATMLTNAITPKSPAEQKRVLVSLLRQLTPSNNTEGA